MSARTNITSTLRGGIRTGAALLGNRQPGPVTIIVAPGHRVPPPKTDDEREADARAQLQRDRDSNREAMRHAAEARKVELAELAQLERDRPKPQRNSGGFQGFFCRRAGGPR